MGERFKNPEKDPPNYGEQIKTSASREVYEQGATGDVGQHNVDSTGSKGPEQDPLTYVERIGSPGSREVEPGAPRGPPALDGFLREWDILGCKRRGIRPLIPISRAAWWNGIREGRFPKPVKLGPRTTCWTTFSIRCLVSELAGNAQRGRRQNEQT